MKSMQTNPYVFNGAHGDPIQKDGIGRQCNTAETVRLDVLVVQRQFVDTRTKAQRLISEGNISVDGKVITKPSTKVSPLAHIVVDKGEDYVSRGAYKLLGALQSFTQHGLPNIHGLRALDIGASTGGFSDVLLRHGASHVLALDVGHGQLDSRISQDSRVTEMSGVNIRDVQSHDLPYRPELIVSDVSFISLRLVLPVVARIANHPSHIIMLIKPQFEVGKGHLGKNGVVDDANLRQQAVDDVLQCAQECGMQIRAVIDSPIAGMHGNAEYLMYAYLP